MNICDDDDDIIESLIHDDDDFTDALLVHIANNLVEEDTDDGDSTLLFPSFVWGCGPCVGKTPNIECHFYSHLLFHALWGPTHIYKNAMFFQEFFKIPSGLFDDIRFPGALPYLRIPYVVSVCILSW